MKTMHPNVQAVQNALTAAGAKGQVVVLPDATATAEQAAAALKVDIGQIVKSLIFDADGGPLLVLTAGTNRVDTGKVAKQLGYASVKRATPEFVKEHTGQPIGGVAPVGHPKPIPTIIDTALAAYDVIWAAGGIPHAVFPTTFDELVRITGGTPAEVA
jgi:prolyl-tRNA editing enzyme YbaK/EbsC (Cys-tRNA(Pro) deacylase)